MARLIWSRRPLRGRENWAAFSCSEDGCFGPFSALDERNPCSGREESSREELEEEMNLGMTLRKRNKLIPEMKRMNIRA